MSDSPFRKPAEVDPGEPVGFPPAPPVVADARLAEATRREELNRAGADFHAAVVAPRQRARSFAFAAVLLVGTALAVFLLAFCAAQP